MTMTRDEQQREAFGHRVREMLRAWREKRGERYAHCSLDGYEIQHDGQRDVVNAIRGYVATLADNLKAGRGLLLFGNSRSGKDHLTSAVTIEAIKLGAVCRWYSGSELFGQFRKFDTVAAMVNQLSRVDVLSLSDPIRLSSELTSNQQDCLLEIFETRYSHNRPVFVTVNVATFAELKEKMGAPIANRIGHDCLALECRWPGYGEVAQ